MSALPAGALAGLRAAMSALNVQTLSYQVRSAGAWASPVSFTALVTEDQSTATLDEPKRLGVRTIRVRPTASILPVAQADRVIYLSDTYVIDDVSGTDVQILICRRETKVGIQQTDRPRFSGA